MTAGLSHRVPRPLGPPTLGALVLLGLTALWTVSVIGGIAGVFSAPFSVLLAVTLPPALVTVYVFRRLRRSESSSAFRYATGWTVLVGAALAGAGATYVLGIAVLVVPAILLVSALCARYPAQAVVLVFALTGSYGTLQAFTPVPPGESADLVLVGLWLSAIWGYLFRGRDRAIWIWPGVAAVLFYIALTAAEIVTATSITNGFHAFRSVAWYMLAFLLIGYGLWRPGTRELMFKGFVLVALLVGTYASFRWVVGPDPREYALAASVDRTNFLQGEFRLVGSFLSGKALASWCAVMLAFCLPAALGGRGRWRVLAALACAGLAIGLLGSQVRSPLVGVIVGVALVFVLFQVARGIPGQKLGVTLGAALVVVVGAAAVFSFTGGSSESSTKRYTLILNPTRDDAFQARLLRWRTVLADLDSHPFGQGLGTSGRIQRERGRFANISAIDIDNSYLQIAFEQGVGVLAIFIVAVLLLLFGLARRAITTPSRDRAIVAIGACGGLAAYLVILGTGSYIEGFNTLTAWMVVGLGVGQFAFPETPGASGPPDA